MKRVLNAFLLLAIGSWIGAVFFDSDGGSYSRRAGGDSERPILGLLDKLDAIYVDAVDRAELEEVAVEAILEHLDPFSAWIPPSYFDDVTEQMQGSFQGVGVEFSILDDTIRVVRVIEGGPASYAGLQPGDRIHAVGDSSVVGPDLDNEKVKLHLKGPARSTVVVSVRRPGFAPGSSAEELAFEIIRGNVAIPSVTGGHIIAAGIGYVHVDRFADDTDLAFEFAVQNLLKQGAEKLVVDLKDNAGGYLHTAIPMASLFLSEGQSVLYTEGKARPRREYLAENDGRWRSLDVAVAMNSGSASASEIFAGALQDHDRALIVGRRSFGKGLVQEEYPVGGGALRLTVSRYYTPSGRSIQKPYYAAGAEALQGDSLASDSMAFFTDAGRTVFGGGGIAPDVNVPLDTSLTRQALVALLWSGWPGRLIDDLVDENRHDFNAVEDVYAWVDYWPSLDFGLDSLAYEVPLELTAGWTSEQHAAFSRSARSLVARRIARQLWGDGAAFFVAAQRDPIVQAAITALQNDELQH